jgi:hypothetical protein
VPVISTRGEISVDSPKFPLDVSTTEQSVSVLLLREMGLGASPLNTTSMTLLPIFSRMSRAVSEFRWRSFDFSVFSFMSLRHRGMAHFQFSLFLTNYFLRK